MSGAQRDQLWRVIAAGRDGILATINPDGTPQLSNVYYLADDEPGVIRFSTTTDRVKGRNLLRDPRASLHVSGRNFLNFSVAQGRVSLLVADRPDGPAVEELRAIHSALGAEVATDRFGEQMVADHRMAVRLDAERIYGQVLDREPRPR